jgi:hypothetical protein
VSLLQPVLLIVLLVADAYILQCLNQGSLAVRG